MCLNYVISVHLIIQVEELARTTCMYTYNTHIQQQSYRFMFSCAKQRTDNDSAITITRPVNVGRKAIFDTAY